MGLGVGVKVKMGATHGHAVGDEMAGEDEQQEEEEEGSPCSEGVA